MACDTFHFQQFSIRQCRSAMKVGTDGVLVGAWAADKFSGLYDQFAPAQILDIGTGNGLIALILAQFFENARITALEIDREAAQEAKDNAAKSKFANRIEVVHQSLQSFTGTTGRKFDCIVSNPPYFVRSFLPPDKARGKARHSRQLPFGALIRSVGRLLTAKGLFALILPFNVSQSFAIEAAAHGLHLVRLTNVRDTSKHAAIRHMLMFSKEQLFFRKDILTLYKKDREEHSAAFYELTKDLYLQP